MNLEQKKWLDAFGYLSDMAGIGLALLDTNEDKIICNKVLIKFLQMDIEECRAGELFVRFEKASETVFRSTLASMEKNVVAEMTVSTNGAKKKWLHVKAIRRLPPDQDLVFLCFFDITREVTQVIEARKKEIFLESILQHIPNMVFVKEAKELRFVLINRVGEKIFGVNSRDVIGKNDFDFFPKEQAEFFIQKDRDVMNRKKTIDIPEEPLTNAHRTYWLHTKKITITDSHGQPEFLLGISEDITEKKRQREVIEEQRRKLLDTARLSSLGELAGSIAHEINNPLMVILGASDQIRNMILRKKMDESRLTMLVERQIKTVERISNIIRSLKGLYRENSIEEFQKATAGEIVMGVRDLVTEKLKRAGIKFETNVELFNELEIECQTTNIMQVLLNLIGNAIGAADGMKGGKIVLNVREAESSVEFELMDWGHGISPENKHKVLESFFSTKAPGKGSGVGLSFSKKIIEAHSGVLELVSISKPTVFLVVLPKRKGMSVSPIAV